MVRFLIRAAIFLASAAIGLLVADLALDDMQVGASSFLVVVGIFAILQAVLAPFIAKTTMRNAPALLGAVGLVSTFVALLVTSLVVDDLTIDGTSTWLLATLIVWLVTMFATFLLPLVLVKLGVEKARANRQPV